MATAYPSALPDQMSDPGWALYAQGDAAGAERTARKALKKAPADVSALQLLSLLLLDQGRAAEASPLIERAVRINPRLARGHSVHAAVLLALGRLEDALQAFRRAEAIEPANAEVQFNLGNTLSDLGRLEEALAAFDAAIALDQGFAEAHRNRGVVLFQLGRHADCVAALDRALALDARMFSALFTRGKAWLALDDPETALRDLAAAVSLLPGEADAHNSRGIVLQVLGRFQDALASFRLATVLDADHAGAHWNEALCRLALGDWSTESWGKYEWGWQAQRYPRRNFAQALWLGREPIAGKTILLHDEQGLGDTIQFARFATDVAALGARVVLQVQAPLKSLMTRLAGPAQVLADGEPLPAFDCHCPLLSLPLALGVTQDNLPRLDSYLTADDARMAQWGARLGPRTRRRVGIAWAGGTAHKDDRNRSMSLAGMLALQSEALELFSLQKELRDGDAALLERHCVTHWGAELDDFEDTAALIMQMDLVIAVSTAVAHLAAALGKPTWILLSYTPDWRWMLERSDTPWHPTVRLFRQKQRGDWAGVMQEVQAALAALPAR